MLFPFFSVSLVNLLGNNVTALDDTPEIIPSGYTSMEVPTEIFLGTFSLRGSSSISTASDAQ